MSPLITTSLASSITQVDGFEARAVKTNLSQSAFITSEDASSCAGK